MNENQIKELKKLIIQQQNPQTDIEKHRITNSIYSIINSHFQNFFSSYKRNYPSEFDDIISIAIIKFNEILPTIKVNDTDKMLTYINRCSKNAVNEYLRKIKRDNNFRKIKPDIENNDKNIMPENKLFDQSNYEEFLSALVKEGFSEQEMQVVKKYFPPTFENHHTLLEVSKIFNLTEQKVQRIIQRAKKKGKEHFGKNKVKKQKVQPDTKQKRTMLKLKKPRTELKTIDISTAFHNFDPTSFFICNEISGNMFTFFLNASCFIYFRPNGEMEVEIDPDFHVSDKIITDVRTQLDTIKIINTENLRSKSNSVRTAGFFYKASLEDIVRYYAPKKTEKEMCDFLKAIGRYEQCRKYITRYKDDFLPPK